MMSMVVKPPKIQTKKGGTHSTSKKTFGSKTTTKKATSFKQPKY